MIYDHAFFDQPINRIHTDCSKWDSVMEDEHQDFNPMWVADMDFASPTEVVDALVERAKHPVYGYTVQSAQAIQSTLDFMKRRHHLHLTKEEHLRIPCVVTGLRSAIRVLTKPTDAVIIQPPVYGPFAGSVEINGRPLAECPLLCDENNRYTMDLESIEKACQNGAKLMLLCNPHNPVGRSFSTQELTDLLALLKKYDVYLAADEIHADLVMPGHTFTPILSVATASDDKVISLNSVSKTFNLAGLQQSVLFARNIALKDAIQKDMIQAGVTSGNLFALTATKAAYDHGDAWLDGLLDYIAKGFLVFEQEVQKQLPKAKISPLEATYLAWLDLRAYGLTTNELMDRCAKEGVMFTEGTFFGKESGEGFLRVNLGCPHARIVDAVSRLAKALHQPNPHV